MKKILALVLTLMLAVTMFAACGEKVENAGETAADTVAKDGVMVIGYTIYEPMNYLEGDKLTGFDTEFAEAVCEKLGYEPEFVEINWDTKFVTLDSKKIDCIWNGMTISDEVKKNCDVSAAYVKTLLTTIRMLKASRASSLQQKQAAQVSRLFRKTALTETTLLLRHRQMQFLQ